MNEPDDFSGNVPMLIRKCLQSAALTVVCFAASPANACLNAYQEELIGLMERMQPAELTAEVAKRSAAYVSNPSIETGNDFAAAQVMSGSYGKAIELLQILEKSYPGSAKTAANLGTALELAGNNAEALPWIKLGIERDPREHLGSEWLHLRIIAAKQSIATNPDWLATNSILGVSFGSDSTPMQPATLPVDHLGHPVLLRDAIVAIRYQLAERVRFATKPDSIVADLMTAAADIGLLLKLKHVTVVEPFDFNSSEYYQAALDFGVTNAALVKTRLAYAKKFEANLVPQSSIPIWLIAILSVVISVGVFLLIRGKRDWLGLSRRI